MPLPVRFEYVHEPLDRPSETIPLLGGRELIDQLKARVRHSTGGAFLVTGFRGVGKTTLVRRSLRELSDDLRGQETVISAVVTVARAMSTNDLLFAVVRRLFEDLEDRGILAALPPSVREAITVSYLRTSLSVRRSTSEASERGLSLDLGLSGMPGQPGATASAKRSTTRASELSYLTYSETDVEYDILRIVRLLTEPPPTVKRRWRRRRRPGGVPRMRLVVVLDEIDKLTDDEGVATIERIVRELKNLFSTRGIHFVFIAGPELHEVAARDAERGNSVYESVFAWQIYVPCLWDASRDLMTCLLRPEHAFAPQLTGHLDFKARGVPRRLFQELNAFVRWTDAGPCLVVEKDDVPRVEFYAGISDILRRFQAGPDDQAALPLRRDEDRWRLSVHYVVDWVMRSGGRPFSIEDIERALIADAGLHPMLGVTLPAIVRLVNHLNDEGVVERIRSDEPLRTRIAAAAPPDVYRLAPTVRSKLSGFARDVEQERGAGVQPPLVQLPDEAAQAAIAIVAERYALMDLIGRGGIGSVYRGRDLRTNADVAIKLLDMAIDMDERTRHRFDREGALARRVHHPDIVRTLDVITTDRGQGIVMELIEGRELAEVVRPDGMPVTQALTVMARILSALEYLNGMGIARIDLKPQNVMMTERGPVIIDLGLARQADLASTRLTITGVNVGTPLYMAPEQFTGNVVGIRSDIYAAGLILVEMLTGRPAKAGGTVMEVAFNTLQRPIDTTDLRVSAELRAAIDKAVNIAPDQRFARPADMLRALTRTPEGRDLPLPTSLPADLTSSVRTPTVSRTWAVPEAPPPPNSAR